MPWSVSGPRRRASRPRRGWLPWSGPTRPRRSRGRSSRRGPSERSRPTPETPSARTATRCRESGRLRPHRKPPRPGGWRRRSRGPAGRRGRGRAASRERAASVEVGRGARRDEGARRPEVGETGEDAGRDLEDLRTGLARALRRREVDRREVGGGENDVRDDAGLEGVDDRPRPFEQERLTFPNGARGRSHARVRRGLDARAHDRRAPPVGEATDGPSLLLRLGRLGEDRALGDVLPEPVE